MSTDKATRDVAEHFRREELTDSQAWGFVLWFFIGAAGIMSSWEWMTTWWGFWLVGVPFLVGIEVLLARAHAHRCRQYPLD